VRTENKSVTISGRFIWHSQRRWRPVFWRRRLKKVSTFRRKKVHPVTWLGDFLTSKWPSSFNALTFAPDDLPHDDSDLEMTWLPWRPGTATAGNRVLYDSDTDNQTHKNRKTLAKYKYINYNTKWPYFWKTRKAHFATFSLSLSFLAKDDPSSLTILSGSKSFLVFFLNTNYSVTTCYNS